MLDSSETAIQEAMRRGDYLDAYDRAQVAADRAGGDLRFEFAATLALARSNATGQAALRYAKLRDRADEAVGTLRVDILALGARIAKDRAFRTKGESANSALRAAAQAYAEVFESTRASFPGVNAATLTLLAGDDEGAHALARDALAAAQSESATDSTGNYYRYATIAEAQLVLGAIDEAEKSLVLARNCQPDAFGSHTTTLKQLQRIVEYRKLSPSVLRCLRAPTAVHYSGHRFGSAVSLHEERRLADAIAACFERFEVGFVFGSLAGGADILFVEAALARGAYAHIVLPFEREDFIRISVAPSGPGWVERFERCLECAESVSYTTTDGYLGDDAVYGYTSDLAMGLASLRAANLLGEARQIVLWDGVASGRGALAGTAADMTNWQATGRQVEIIEMPPGLRSPKTPDSDLKATNRTTRVMLFGDVKGFSKLRDGQLLAFSSVVLGALAAVLDRYPEIELRNTWGDGLFIVMDDVIAAANCALDLQEAMAAIDLVSENLPTTMGLRLGMHYGPVFPVLDPITRVSNFIGEQVSRSARIEPVTPEGSVYVTEAFAAAISLRPNADFRCEYVGEVDAAKGYGKFRMHALERGR